MEVIVDIKEAIEKRHSVRKYSDKPIEENLIEELKKEIEACNTESGLNIQLVTNEPKAFGGAMAHYGKFSGVSNYLAMIGKKDKFLDEKVGYYGERLVLKAQQLGLNTCWVALTYKKVPEAFTINKGEKLLLVISVGYGENQGNSRKSKKPEEVSNISADSPEWFKQGIEVALLAPTAMNQQRFYFSNENGKVSAKAKLGFYTKVDLGIAKYHFEIGAGKDCFEWKK